jgi:hypothetical protein
MDGEIDLSFTMASHCAGFQNCGCYKRSILVLLQDAETTLRWGPTFGALLVEVRFGFALLP